MYAYSICNADNSEDTVFLLIFKGFYLFMRDRQRERERQRHRQSEKQAPHGKPNMGLDPRTLGSTAEPPRHPSFFIKKY